MSDEPDSLVLRILRRMDERIDRMAADLGDIRTSGSVVARQLAATDRLLGDFRIARQNHHAAIVSRFDGLDRRFDRIERRLESHPA